MKSQFIKNTGEGISIIANGIDFNPAIASSLPRLNTRKYLSVDGYLPPQGCELVMIPEETDGEARKHVPLEKIIAETSHPRTKLVTLSHVEYASGQRHDLRRSANSAASRESCSASTRSRASACCRWMLQSMHIDYLAADGHKWLLGPEGAGILFVRRDLIPKTPAPHNRLDERHQPQDYGHYDFTLKPDAGKYECGTYNVPGLHGLKGRRRSLITVASKPSAHA